ncbi:putative protein BRICK1 [Balamuthia mandrillaris]
MGDKHKTAVQEDWEEREFIENITNNIKKIAEFLNRFGYYPLSSSPSLPFISFLLLLLLLLLLLFLSTLPLSHANNNTDTSTRYKLAAINEKLTQLERQMEHLEAALSSVSAGGSAPAATAEEG